MKMLDIGSQGSQLFIDVDKIETIEQSHSSTFRSVITMVGGRKINCEALWPREILKAISELEEKK